MRAGMERVIRSNKLEARVHLPGARAEVAAPLSAFDLFLLTSKFEGTPNVVLEAQWLGVPIVATDSGGTREAVEEGVTGWICDSADPGRIAKRVVSLFHDDITMQNAARLGPSFIERRFGMQRMIEETLRVYNLAPHPAIEQSSEITT
jgi:glycosyltransferase involved in cell wall biosynthesis